MLQYIFSACEPLSGYFCGLGPNRQDCPAEYYCNIHPADRFAVCCPNGKHYIIFNKLFKMYLWYGNLFCLYFLLDSGSVPTVSYILLFSILCFLIFKFNLSLKIAISFSGPNTTTGRSTTTDSTTSSIATLGDTSASTSIAFHFTLHLFSLSMCFVY